MVIFGIASLGFIGLTTNTLRANAMAHHRSFATAFAQDKIEEVRAGGACTGGTASQGDIQFSLACTTTAGPNGTNNVTVLVTWADPSSQNVQLQFRM
jgi:Tfp pilus assembly protein PilV